MLVYRMMAKNYEHLTRAMQDIQSGEYGSAETCFKTDSPLMMTDKIVYRNNLMELL